MNGTYKEPEEVEQETPTKNPQPKQRLTSPQKVNIK